MSDPHRDAREFDLIERIRRRVHSRDDVVLGIGDDAALLQVPAGRWLVVAADTLNAGVHFPEDTAPADVGWKSLAVNLSDLAAMGAEPAWCTLSLSLPGGDAHWVDGFLDGFLELAHAHRVALVGGDTTRGPLSISVTVHGFVAPNRALRREAACVGDDVWVSGTLGDAAGALAQWRAGSLRDAFLRARLDRPTPRLALGAALADVANACIDVSDGLLADLAHVARASGVGARVELDRLPASDALRAAFDDATRHAWQATGGDDYELCFTAASQMREEIERIARETGTPVARIGRIEAGEGVRAVDALGAPWESAQVGYQHFA
ncbi:thiamine-phosphate kinase [Lysobacter auxotrophicus]|uniref:Thiamine-monophosphate kinase n=1 Tax=Lysobacter auxotrophicus TaxID=2992573 RepID=A0ABN6UGY3_9GAMM|nr:thiamine-phosphate kinase [Lysobacter auxotrophicus]BDU15528.1 thiamine-phosphate kinase [Lysobacter auxotrophicus]